MASGARFERCRAIRPGVVATMTSGGVQVAVGQLVGRLAERANAQAVSRRADLPPRVSHGLEDNTDYPVSRPYRAEVRVGRYDALGVVVVATNEGAHDQNQHHTLDSLNH